MKQAQFEALHQDTWQAFRAQLDRLEDRNLHLKRRAPFTPEAQAFLTRYRQICRHLALSEARGYSPALSQSLHALVLRGHRQLSRQSAPLHLRLHRFAWVDFPAAVRAESTLFWLISLLFYGVSIGLGLAVYHHPELGLTLLGDSTAERFVEMYDPSQRLIGPYRDAGDDLSTFGFYISNNVGVSFRCFASGLFLGAGSLFSVFYNAVHGGAVAGYLSSHGLAESFFSFICGHAPWELTAILLSATAGCRVGFSLIAPGPLSRRDALVAAGRRAATLMWGVAAMLVIAAFFEAFWSAHADIPAHTKYLVSGVNTWLVTFYFLRMGKADAGH